MSEFLVRTISICQERNKDKQCTQTLQVTGETEGRQERVKTTTTQTAGTHWRTCFMHSLSYSNKLDTSLHFHTTIPHTHTYTHQLNYSHTLIKLLARTQTSTFQSILISTYLAKTTTDVHLTNLQRRPNNPLVLRCTANTTS